MSLESDYGIDSKKASAIAAYLRPFDRLFEFDIFSFLTAASGLYQQQFGNFNFAAIEKLFREFHFHTHFLAVPSWRIEFEFPYFIIADINSVSSGQLIRKPYVALPHPSQQTADISAEVFGITYTTDQNSSLLRDAGFFVPRPGSDVSAKWHATADHPFDPYRN